MENKVAAETALALHNQMANLPHRTYGPSLVYDGLEWVATFGTTPESRLVGRGECPMAALTSFDQQWMGLKA